MTYDTRRIISNVVFLEMSDFLFIDKEYTSYDDEAEALIESGLKFKITDFEYFKAENSNPPYY